MKIEQTEQLDNFIPPIADTNFGDFLLECEELLEFEPRILKRIEKDLDAQAKRKKQLRVEDKRFYENFTADLPYLSVAEREISRADLRLEHGRPRMPAYWVYLFMMIRGYLGSLSDQRARDFLRESKSLESLLQKQGYRMPGFTTMIENVNAISEVTHDYIQSKQLRYILKEELDDFKTGYIDSTSVASSSGWPTDGKILNALICRAHRLGQKLHLFEREDFGMGWMEDWLSKMDRLEMHINFTVGKANGKGKRKRHYRQLLKNGKKALGHLSQQLEKQVLDPNLGEKLAPSRRAMWTRVMEQIRQDIADAYQVVGYTEERIFNGKKIGSEEKILSVSDESAYFIKKGGRNPVLGYKPQIVRSQNGFVVALKVPQGNSPDSVELVPMATEAIKRTGIQCELISVDDGYASRAGHDQLLKMGVKVVSISGAKGKKLIGEDWENQTYREARNGRSAIESLMFTIKHGFHFGRVSRRGLAAVRAELLEKILAYNCCRIISTKKSREKLELQKAA